MTANFSIMIIVAIFFAIAGVSSGKSPVVLWKLTAQILCYTVGVILLALWWGAGLYELLTLKLDSKSGVAMGIMYGGI